MAGVKISDLPAVPSSLLTDVFPADQGAVTYKETLQQVLTLFQANGAALSKVNDTNVTLTLAGSPANALLNATSLTLGWTGQLSPTRGGTGIATYILGDTLYSSAVNTLAKLSGNITSAKQFLSQTGTGVVSAAPAWSAISSSDIPGSALTKTDDTNVTLTLGGSPSTALLNAASLTLGWTGQLSVARGGTGLAALTAHYIPIGNGTTALTLLAPNATTGIPLISQGAASDPTYGTAVVAGGGTGNTTFTAYSVICAGTTATGAFQNVSGVGSATQVLTSNGAGLLPTWQAITASVGAALTKVDDTNVTLTLGGTPTTALLQATSLTLGWTGQLGPTRGGTGIGTYTLGDTLYSSASNTLAKLAGNITTTKQYLSQTGDGALSAAPTWATVSGTDITGAALTKVDDTNVTLTLGGTPTTALLRSASITAGWTGQLGLTRGGTAASLTASNGGIVYSTASALAILGGTATANQVLLSGASTTPAWSTATYPATTTVNQLLYSSSTNVIGGVTAVNSGALVSTSAGVPTWIGSLTNGQLAIGSTSATPVAATITAGTNISVTNGAGSITIAASGFGAFAWNDVSGTTQAATINNGYIISNASQTTVTLPSTAAVGSVVAVQGKGAAGWILAQNASQLVHFGNATTTTGTGGTLTSTNLWDSVQVVCVTANTTWAVLSAVGNLTVV